MICEGNCSIVVFAVFFIELIVVHDG